MSESKTSEEKKEEPAPKRKPIVTLSASITTKMASRYPEISKNSPRSPYYRYVTYGLERVRRAMRCGFPSKCPPSDFRLSAAEWNNLLFPDPDRTATTLVWVSSHEKHNAWKMTGVPWTARLSISEYIILMRDSLNNGCLEMAESQVEWVKVLTELLSTQIIALPQLLKLRENVEKTVIKMNNELSRDYDFRRDVICPKRFKTDPPARRITDQQIWGTGSLCTPYNSYKDRSMWR